MTNNKRPEQPPQPPETVNPYSALDPIPQPDVVEKNTDTMWALWNDVQDKEQVRFADTAPMTVPGVMPRPGAVRPPAQIRPAPPTTQMALVTLVQEVRLNNRVCPKPEQWAHLHAQLAAAAAPSALRSLPPLLTSHDWRATNAVAKRLTFRSVIDWAETSGLVEEVLRFVRALPEEQWHHMGE